MGEPLFTLVQFDLRGGSIRGGEPALPSAGNTLLHLFAGRRARAGRSGNRSAAAGGGRRHRRAANSLPGFGGWVGGRAGQQRRGAEQATPPFIAGRGPAGYVRRPQRPPRGKRDDSGTAFPPPPPSHGYLPVCRGDGRCGDGAVRLQLPLPADG
eukprot:scaffold1320_cov113-Isochrysis_galbana.AAC.8